MHFRSRRCGRSSISRPASGRKCRASARRRSSSMPTATTSHPRPAPASSTSACPTKTSGSSGCPRAFTSSPSTSSGTAWPARSAISSRKGCDMRTVVAIDQGTTGSTVMVLDEKLEVLAKVNREFPQLYPKPGWVEHDPEAIWGSVLSALGAALSEARADPKSIAAIGITNQRETTVVWDKRTGEAPRTAIVWQDRRTADRCAELKAGGHEA